MSRVVKFRAWTSENMVYQEDQYLGSFIRRAVAEINADHGEEPREHESYLPNGGDIEEYLMQYTGVKDKNDVEIYEGDALEVAGYTLSGPFIVNFHNATYVIEGQSDPSKPTVQMGRFSPDDVRVIGNIYENPELVKVAL